MRISRTADILCRKCFLHSNSRLLCKARRRFFSLAALVQSIPKANQRRLPFRRWFILRLLFQFGLLFEARLKLLAFGFRLGVRIQTF